MNSVRVGVIIPGDNLSSFSLVVAYLFYTYVKFKSSCKIVGLNFHSIEASLCGEASSSGMFGSVNFGSSSAGV